MPSWERQTPPPKTESPVEAEGSGRASGVLKWLFVALAVVAVIGGGALIMLMETDRRNRLAREDFLNQKQNAFSAIESGELTSALSIFSRLTSHPGRADEHDSVSKMVDVLSQMTNPTAIENQVSKLDDSQLLRLHNHGHFDDALYVDASLKGKPQENWIAALRSASRREVPRRHSERKKTLAEMPRRLAEELAELHSSQLQTLRQTNRLEVEEKTAQRWINDLHEKLSSTLPLALNCADWRDRYSFNDAKAIAEQALKRDPAVQNPQLLIDTCSSIYITRTLDGLSMNMREVPKVVSVTTRYQAEFTIKISQSVDIQVNHETLRTSSQHSETVLYAWQSDRWVLKNPGGYLLLAEILPEEIR